MPAAYFRNPMHYFGVGYSNSQWNFGTCGYQDHNGILFPFFYGVQENTDAEIQAVDSVCRIKSYISDQTGWSVTFSGVTDLFLCDNFADLCILWNYFYQILMALFTKMSHFGFYVPWIFPLFSFKPVNTRLSIVFPNSATCFQDRCKNFTRMAVLKTVNQYSYLRQK